MTKQAIIEKTMKAINQLPLEKAEEISDFADFIARKYEDQQLAQGMQQITSDSEAFRFLQDEEDLYTVEDLKEVYNG